MEENRVLRAQLKGGPFGWPTTSAGHRVLICDRDTKWTEGFRGIVKGSGVRVVLAAFQGRARQWLDRANAPPARRAWDEGFGHYGPRWTDRPGTR